MRHTFLRTLGLPFAIALVAGAPVALAQSQGYPPPYPPSAYPRDDMRPRQFDVTAFGGYQLNGDITTSGGNLDIADSPSFGAAFDYRLSPIGSLELIWIYTKPDANFFSLTPLYPSSQTFGVATHYFQIGGMSSFPRGGFEPFVALGIGAALYLPDTITFAGGGSVNADATWRFAASGGVGAKIWITPNVGLRLETRLLAPMVFHSGGYYYGTGGTGVAVSSGIPSLQVAFLGGLSFGK